MHSSRLASVALGALLALGVARTAAAEDLRGHGTLALAKPLGEWQSRELPWGGAGFLAAELALAPQIGPQLELGLILLGDGDDPRDAGIQPQDGAHAVYGAVGFHARPFVDEDAAVAQPVAGIWAATNFGATTTGGLFRAVWDAHLGYDFLLSGGRYGVGPTLGLVHVFQSDDHLRPDDANIFVVGAHFVVDTGAGRTRDRDGDGVIDRRDRCPDVAEDKDGFEDGDGCPDTDNDRDGVLDRDDACVEIPEDKDGFEDKDGCPENDNDKDGILDPVDKCPTQAEDKDDFEDEDGCPDPDNDDDGLPDRVDLCPNEPETVNDYADDDGCPDEDQVRVVGERIVLDDRVHFEQNNAIIRPVSYPLLERLARLILSQPSYEHIEVHGHTDQKGTVEFNKKLSEDRAKAVVDFLVKHGVAKDRLSSVGFGSSKLLVEKTNERALYLNRRVEFVITRLHKGRVETLPPVADPAEATPAPQPEDAPEPGAPPAAGSEKKLPAPAPAPEKK